jgi:hypothetical protein
VGLGWPTPVHGSGLGLQRDFPIFGADLHLNPASLPTHGSWGALFVLPKGVWTLSTLMSALWDSVLARSRRGILKIPGECGTMTHRSGSPAGTLNALTPAVTRSAASRQPDSVGPEVRCHFGPSRKCWNSIQGLSEDNVRLGCDPTRRTSVQQNSPRAQIVLAPEERLPAPGFFHRLCSGSCLLGTAPFRTVAFMPTRTPSPMVQPCSTAPCPTLTF